MAKPKTKRPVATLGFTRLSVHDLIGRGNAIVEALTGNKSFPSPTPTLATLTSAVTALVNAQAVALTKAKGAVEERNAKRVEFLTEFETLRSYVQSVADADGANAAALIESAGLGVRKTPNRQPKQNLAVKAGVVSGAAKVVAKAALGKASYDWQTSTDEKTWTALPSSTQAHVSVSGLTPGATVYYRFRTVTKTGVGDWSQPVSYFVH